MPKLVSRNPAATRRFAGSALRRFASKSRRPLTLALSGELGSGKTTFVQGLARALGIREHPRSPTFVLAKRYQVTRRGLPWRHFVHVDAYRIERPSEARRIGLAEILDEHDAIVVVEWADRIRKLIPRSAVWVRFMHGKEPRERRLQIPKL